MARAKLVAVLPSQTPNCDFVGGLRFGKAGACTLDRKGCSFFTFTRGLPKLNPRQIGFSGRDSCDLAGLLPEAYPPPNQRFRPCSSCCARAREDSSPAMQFAPLNSPGAASPLSPFQWMSLRLLTTRRLCIASTSDSGAVQRCKLHRRVGKGGPPPSPSCPQKSGPLLRDAGWRRCKQAAKEADAVLEC